MTLSISITTPGLRELTITPTTAFLETKRLCIYLNLWSRWTGAPSFEWSKQSYTTSACRTLRIGCVSLEVSWGTVTGPAIA